MGTTTLGGNSAGAKIFPSTLVSTLRDSLLSGSRAATTMNSAMVAKSMTSLKYGLVVEKKSSLDTSAKSFFKSSSSNCSQKMSLLLSGRSSLIINSHLRTYRKSKTHVAPRFLLIYALEWQSLPGQFTDPVQISQSLYSSWNARVGPATLMSSGALKCWIVSARLIVTYVS